MTPSPTQPRDLSTDELPRPVINLGGPPNGSSPARGAQGPASCELLPERIDALIKVQTAQHGSLLAEIGHLRVDVKDLSLAVRELATEIRPLVHDRVDAQAMERAQAKLFEQQSNVSKAWADLVSSPTTKAVIAAILAAAASIGALRGCGVIEPSVPQLEAAQADGAWWRHR